MEADYKKGRRREKMEADYEKRRKEKRNGAFEEWRGVSVRMLAKSMMWSIWTPSALHDR